MASNRAKLKAWFKRYEVSATSYLARLTAKAVPKRGTIFPVEAAAIAAAKLATPGTFVATNASPITLDWADVVGATGYVVETADNAAFTENLEVIYTGTVSAVTTAIPIVPSGADIYFRVKATHLEKDDSDWATASIVVA